MEEEIVALAATASSTLVTLLATDSWNRVKSGVLAYWRRRSPHTLEEVEGTWENAHAELESSPEHRDQVNRALSEHLVGLLATSSAPETELHSFIGELQVLSRANIQNPRIEINATTHDHGQTNIVGQGEMRVGGP